MRGQRKFWMCMAYLGCCAALDMTAIVSAGDTLSLAEMGGLASLNASLATGLGVIVWGNVESHRANGGTGGGK